MGVNTGVTSPPRIAVLKTRETLAAALASLKAKREGYSNARERAEHALAVGYCAVKSMTR